MVNAILIGILAVIVGGIVGYLWRAKKRGDTCVGCPYAKQCGGHCGGCGNTKPNDKREHQ